MPPQRLELPKGWQAWPPERKLALRDRLRLAKFQTRYRYDPAAFVYDCIDWGEGERPATYQLDVLNELIEHGREAARGPHGLGKTAIMSWAVHWFALTRDGIDDWKVPTTASLWRQLNEFLWPEIHKWARRLRWDAIGRAPYDERTELQTLALRLDTGSAFALSSDDPAGIEGAHADCILYIYDEAKTIPDATFDASEGAFSGAGPDTPREAYALAGSTPGEPVGRFYDIHARKAGYEDWNARHVTIDEAIDAGRISRVWVEQRGRQWGTGSSLYANRVLGEFDASGEQNVIPLAWVEAAQERWRFLMRGIEAKTKQLPDFTCVGVDVADEGADQTVLALRYGDVIAELRKFSLGDTMETTGRVTGVLRARKGYAVVDVIGLGAGPVARLKELKVKVQPFNASAKSTATDASGELEFANLRAEAWWSLREKLDPVNDPAIAIPDDDELTGDLTAPRWKMTSAGKILIESKPDIKKRIGRSTDSGDAVVMALWSRWKPATVHSAAGQRLPSPRR